MNKALLYPIGSTKAITYAASYLHREGISLIDHPAPEITHLLLDVPSFAGDGLLKNGAPPESVLERLPANITVIGGNLEHPALEGYRTMDLLADEQYLFRNAAITADCALRVAFPKLNTTLTETPTLIIGWGRIGKCLARMLRAVDCPVTVAVRKEKDQAALTSLGYDVAALDQSLAPYRLIFNTASGVTLTNSLSIHPTCVKIDLASARGLPGDDVIWARGLPGIHAPESSGRLIAQTILQRIKEEYS